MESDAIARRVELQQLLNEWGDGGEAIGGAGRANGSEHAIANAADAAASAVTDAVVAAIVAPTSR